MHETWIITAVHTMNFRNIFSILFGLSLLAACASDVNIAKPRPSFETIKCSTFEVTNERETLGTGFFINHDSKVLAVTAAHLLLAVNRSAILIRPTCLRESIRVKSYSKLAGIDAAILFSEDVITANGFSVSHSKQEFANTVYSVGFPNLQIAEPRLKRMPIPTTGLLVQLSPSDILATLNVVQRGSSGSPIFDGNGNLLGMLTNRVLIDGDYTGVTYGISEQSLRTALSLYFNSSAK